MNTYLIRKGMWQLHNRSTPRLPLWVRCLAGMFFPLLVVVDYVGWNLLHPEQYRPPLQILQENWWTLCDEWTRRP